MAEFRDKVVVITGASSGLGAATALEFATKGCKLVITGRNEERLEDVKQQCLKNGTTQVATVVSDLSTEDGVKQVVETTLEKFGTIHVLVNNAGGFSPDQVEEADIRVSKGKIGVLDYSYKVLVRAPWQLSGLFVDELIKNKGCIINSGSIASHIPMPPIGQYGAMKAALDYMTKLMAAELGMNGVRVNGLLIGTVETPIYTQMGMTVEESYARHAFNASKMAVLGQKVQPASAVAKATVFLASDDAASITGVLLPVDGGCLVSSACFDFTK